MIGKVTKHYQYLRRYYNIFFGFNEFVYCLKNVTTWPSFSCEFKNRIRTNVRVRTNFFRTSGDTSGNLVAQSLKKALVMFLAEEIEFPCRDEKIVSIS
jgi:hypothetical protein